MLEAKDIYGWQFVPSYYEIVAQTLATTSKGEGSSAPVALPIPSAMVDYNLGKESAPPPLVEGALYGYFYPLDVLTELATNVGGDGAYPGEYDETARGLLATFQAVAWKDTIEVFIPGFSAPGSKSECLFFPHYWAGRISDRGTIALLPLLSFRNSGKNLGRGGEDYTLEHPYIFSFASTLEKAQEAGRSAYESRDPGGPLLRWMIFDPKGLHKLFAGEVAVFFETVKDIVRGAPGLRSAAMTLPKNPADKNLKAVSEFGALTSPAIIPTVGWETVVEYMNTASYEYHLLINTAPDSTLENPEQDPENQEQIDASREEFYGWKDFGSTQLASDCMVASQALYRLWDDATFQKGELRVARVSSSNAVFAGFAWWGMANSEWLNAHSTLVKQQIVIALNSYIEDTNRPQRLVESFKFMAFPFRVGDGTKIPKATDFVNEAGNLSPTGRRFYEDYILPVVKAGGTPPNLTLEEAAEAVAVAEAVAKEAKEKAGAQGEASKNLTKAKATDRKNIEKHTSAKEKHTSTQAELDKYREEAGEALGKIEKLQGLRGELEVMGVPTDAVDSQIVAAQKEVGPEFAKATEAHAKATEKLGEASVAWDESTREVKKAEEELADLTEKSGKAVVDLEEAKNTEKAVIALGSYVYVPSTQGYYEFIQDVRRSYDGTGAGTARSAVARAFKWFSGSPQATEAQTGRWSSGSAWQEGLNKAVAVAAGMGRTEDRLGRFPGPDSSPRVTPKPTRVVAGPVDVTLMDGTQRRYQAGRPRDTQAGKHIVFEDINVVFANEFAPLFEAYKEAYPEREVEAGYENLVLEVIESARTLISGEWTVTVEPVAFFVNEFTPISDVTALMDADAVKLLPLGVGPIPIEPNDPYVILPPKWRLAKLEEKKKKKKKKNPIKADSDLDFGF